MNRAERRAFTKQAKKNGISKEGIQAYLACQEAGLGQPIPPVELHDGDLVTLNTEQIKNRNGYNDRMSQRYRDFVESNEDTVFTVHVESNGLISFTEHPEWLFYSGDLKLVEENRGVT